MENLAVTFIFCVALMASEIGYASCLSDKVPSNGLISEKNIDYSCHSAITHFKSFINQTSHQIVPSYPVLDTDLQTCHTTGPFSPPNCCKRQIELLYEAEVEKLFYQHMDEATQSAKKLLLKRIDLINLDNSAILTSGISSSAFLLTSTFKIPGDAVDAVLRPFTVAVLSSLKLDSLIGFSVDELFDNLFPLVYKYVLSDPKSVKFDRQMEECLAKIRLDIRPGVFGESPNRLKRQLSKSMQLTAILRSALKSGMHVIDDTAQAPITRACKHSLTRMAFCQQCRGADVVSPCRNYCLNIARGCLATIAEIDRHWNVFIQTLRSLSSSLTSTTTIGLANSLGQLDNYLNEAILHSMETSHRFLSEIESRCSVKNADHQASKPSPSTLAARAKMGKRKEISKSEEAIMTGIVKTEGIFRSLGDSLCLSSKQPFASEQNNKACWTGTHIGSYKRKLVDIDLEDQLADNPEISVVTSKSRIITKVIDQLQSHIKIIREKLAGEIMLGDDPHVRRYQAWGDGMNTLSDDEDGEGDSSSGSGSGEFIAESTNINDIYSKSQKQGFSAKYAPTNDLYGEKKARIEAYNSAEQSIASLFILMISILML